MLLLLSIMLIFGSPDSVKVKKPIQSECKQMNSKLDTILIKLNNIKIKQNAKQVSITRKK